MARRAKVIRFPKSPPEPPQADLVEVRRCRDETEALGVKSLLESEEIPCVLRSPLSPPPRHTPSPNHPQTDAPPPPLPPPARGRGTRPAPPPPSPCLSPQGRGEE